MSTRSFIGIVNKGSIDAIYCHFDGYPSGVGEGLKEYFAVDSKVRSLIKLGDISNLGKTNKSTIAYGRDYNRADTESKTYNSDSEFLSTACDHGCEYAYLFESGEWTTFEL